LQYGFDRRFIQIANPGSQHLGDVERRMADAFWQALEYKKARIARVTSQKSSFAINGEESLGPTAWLRPFKSHDGASRL
jgi:hypothetical protein